MEWVKQWGGIVGLALGGVVILSYGLWEQVKPGEVVVEIISGRSENRQVSETAGQLTIGVMGAVQKPGEYKLSSDSRIGDALVAAGGVTAVADRGWVRATLDLDQRLEGGSILYIPSVGEGDPARLNINQASEAELDALEGIGEVRAKAIVANRPYKNTREIIEKARIPESVYEKIRDYLRVF